MKSIRIFISSPGDVAEERERARQVVEGLRRRYAGSFYLQPVLWEDLPLQADMSFQQGIDLVLSSEHGIDVAVFVLWSRLGSPLGARIRKNDGTEYRSGTERELDLMLEARRQTGGDRPALLVYARQDESSFDERLRGKPTQEKEDLIAQKKLVEQFIAEEFHEEDTGHNVRAYHSFDRPVTFSQRLRAHLTGLLDEIAGAGVAAAVWDIEKEGPPFLGLEAFQPRHADVFFGREEEILEARHALGMQARNGCAFLLLSGASGSGKSSLARAGVLPAIVENELDDQISAWHTVVVSVAELGSDPLTGLVRRLAADDVLPELRGEEVTPDELSDDLRREPQRTIQRWFKEAFARAARRQKGGVRVLLVLDQLEELFSSAGSDETSRREFLEAVEAMARGGNIWVLATVRSDFSVQVQAQPALVRMQEGRGLMTLLPPESDSLRRLIEEPARLAGLAYEVREDQNLAGRILRDASAHAELLPLVEYVLRELFEQRTENGLLTWEAYEALGGVEGALAKRAEDVFQQLPGEAREALGGVLKALVTIGEEDRGDLGEPIVRQRASLKIFTDKEGALALIRALTAERLLTTSEDPATGEAVVMVAHESLLRVWPRAVSWADDNREFLWTRARVAARQREGSPLLEGDPLLDSAKTHLIRDPEGFSADQRAFVQDSIERAERMRLRRERMRRRVLVGLSMLTCASLLGGAGAVWQWKEAVTERERAEAGERDARQAKEVAEIERARAEKGEMEAKAARERAVAAKEAADGLIRFMQYDLRDTLGSLGRLSMMEGINERIRRYHEEHPPEPGDQAASDRAARERSVALSQQGDILMAQGQLAEALQAYRDSLEISDRLAGQDPQNATWQIGRMYSSLKIGDVLRAQGQVAEALKIYRDSLEINERLAKQDPLNANWQYNLSACYDRIGYLLHRQGQVAEAIAFWRNSSETIEHLFEQDPDNMDLQRDLSRSYRRLGAMLLAQGQVAEALKSYRDSLELSERLTQQDPHNVNWKDHLSAGYVDFGDALRTQGQTPKALKFYRDALEIRERLAQQDPPNADWQRDLSQSYSRIAEVLRVQGETAEALKFFRSSLQINERLAAQDPDNADWLSDLSYSYRRIGDVLYAQGRVIEALKSYRDCLQVSERLTEQNPRNPDWQRERFTGYEKIGDMLSAQGQVAEALDVYRDALENIERVAEQNPHWQRDLFSRYIKIGDVFWAHGQIVEALRAYRNFQKLLERPAEQDPQDATWQRDLSARYVDIGDALRAQGQVDEALKLFLDSLEIRERLAEQDPHNRDWQRDLSVGYERLGDMVRAQGQVDEAFKLFRDSLEIRERLAEQDPHNADRQRELSVSYERLGDVLRAQGQVDEALKLFRDSLEIREQLAEQDPHNANWQRDLATIYLNVGDVLKTQGQAAKALKFFRDCLEIIERLAEQDPRNAVWQRDLAISYINVGVMLEEQERFADAFKAYRSSLEVYERAAERDLLNANWQPVPSLLLTRLANVHEGLRKKSERLDESLTEQNSYVVDWQQDLFVSYVNLGGIFEEQKQFPQALEAYQSCLEISERLVELDPRNPGWQRGPYILLTRIGDVHKRLQNNIEAIRHKKRAVEILEELIRVFPDVSQFSDDLVWIRETYDEAVEEAKNRPAAENDSAGIEL